ncbi:hypothetical protein [Arthrobacter sp. C152]
MTVVNISVQAPADGGPVAAQGSLRWEPTGRRIGADGALVLPAGFTVPLVGGIAAVDVEPSTNLWAWTVTELFAGQPAKRRTVAVPDTGPVDYTALTPVDPATLESTLTVSPDPDNPGFYLIGA